MLRRAAPALAAALAASLALAGCGMVPQGRDTGTQASSTPRVPTAAAVAIARPETQQCMARLGGTGARFSPVPDRYYGAGCQTLSAVHIDALPGDDAQFAVSNMTAVACPLANTLAGWARFGVDRAARQILGSALVRIETMGSYSCRTIAGSSRMSAHSRAEAIDVSAFILADGRRISVLDGWGASPSERRFLRTVHDSACKRFGTVLGPEYNAAHKNHLHLEEGGGGFCR